MEKVFEKVGVSLPNIRNSKKALTPEKTVN